MPDRERTASKSNCARRRQNNLWFFIFVYRQRCASHLEHTDRIGIENKKKTNTNASCSCSLHSRFPCQLFWFTMFYRTLKMTASVRPSPPHNNLFACFMFIVFIECTYRHYRYTWSVRKLDGPLNETIKVERAAPDCVYAGQSARTWARQQYGIFYFFKMIST